MTRIAIIYHSERGRTRIVAEEIAKGVQSVTGAQAELVSVTETIDWALLEQCDGLIFGSPTYMGSVSAPFKQFIDSSGEAWLPHRWKNKVAAAFTNSHSYSGDKLGALMQLAIFAAQHGMIWVGVGDMPEGSEPQHVNRLSSFMGAMTQSDTTVDPDPPPSGDRKTAFRLGARVAEIAGKLKA